MLDDNKTLCLANGERIKLPATVSMVFEVNDLAVASPATVSRCGMVYMEPLYISWQPFLKTWQETVIEPRLPGYPTPPPVVGFDFVFGLTRDLLGGPQPSHR